MVTQINFYPSNHGRQESLKKQIDRSGVRYTLLSREESQDKGKFDFSTSAAVSVVYLKGVLNMLYTDLY